MATILGLVSFRVYPTYMGGQKGVAHFYEYLQKHLDVVLAGSMDNQPTGRVKMERLLYPNRQIYKNATKISALKHLAASANAQIIVAEHSYAGWIAWLLQKKTSRPFIIHSHNIESKRFQKMGKWWWRLYHYYEGWIHRKARYNFFISQEDLEFAVSEFGLDPARCSVATYGIMPANVSKERGLLKKQLGLDDGKTILLFNGTLDYEPNYDAVTTLIEEIEPRLRRKLNNYQIIVTGNRAPRELAKKMLEAENLDYTGYVEDVNLYYQAADIFLNPVANDTGVKTKLIEAIANNCTTVSTFSGASGIRKDLCGEKLVTVPDSDWESFSSEVASLLLEPGRQDTPPAFYDYYSWENITGRVARDIEQCLLS